MNIPEYFSQRASVRNYTAEPIAAADIEAMLAAAAHAPNTGNMQLCSVVVTDDPAQLKALQPCHFSQPAIMNAPVALTFCADIHRFERWCECRDAKPGFDNLQMLLAAMMDATIFAQQFVTIAEMNGLGTCYLGTTLYNAKEIAEVLHLPAGVVPVMTVTVGNPEGVPADAGRLPIEAIVHHGVYHDYTDADIDRLYAEKENRADSQAFVAENNKATLAQVFADVRYPAAVNREFSAKLSQFLAAAGFNLS